MASSSVSGERLQYPPVRRDDSVVDDYHSFKIGDPYRWLEDPDSEEVKEFVQNQVKLTDSVLEKCETREKLRQNITKYSDYPRYHSPFRKGTKQFYFHNTGLQAQSVIYMRDYLTRFDFEVLLDLNTLSDDGTMALTTFSVSEDAKYLALGLSASGSDWVTIKVMNIEDKKLEPDNVSWVKFSGITWTHDSKGFFYCRYPAPKEGEDIDAGTKTNSNLFYHQLYYHFLGTDQSQDILCWRDHENPKYMFRAEVTNDGKYLVMSIEEGCDPVNKLYYCDMTSFSSGGLESFRGSSSFIPFIKLVDTFDAQYSVISNDETLFTILTNKDAYKYKLVRVDLMEPNSWTVVVEEHAENVLASACAVNGNQLVTCYTSYQHIVQIRDLISGSLLHELLIDSGAVSDISARRKDTSFYFSFTNFFTPSRIYRCDLASDNEYPYVEYWDVTAPGCNWEGFQTTHLFYPSKDGTKIPMLIVAKKDLKRDRLHPCLLYAYGGFTLSTTPSFSASRIVLSKHLGVILCFAIIRGGKKYGEEWHKAGSLAKMQNCFEDFISAAEYLVSAGYTQPSKLCIEGGKNTGLVICACINQRPDLFGCALAHEGIMDMLRFHKFTIGHARTSDYGCAENEEEFHWLIKYSPLHNVKRPWEHPTDNFVQYPPTMFLIADHDDKVVPLHSLKLLATLQHVLCTSLENSPQTNPIIGRIEVKAGHGSSRPIRKMIDEAADRYAFMAKMVNASWTE